MEKQTFDIITLDWCKEDYKNVPDKSGLYQIYGTSPLYGLDTLLYIGQAKNLRQRIQGHFEFKDGVIGRQPNKSCRYAVLDESLLNIAEQILIIMHKPSFNSSSLIKVSPKVKEKGFYIQNHGERGLLNIEVTNYYFLKHPNYDNIEFEIRPSSYINYLKQ